MKKLLNIKTLTAKTTLSRTQIYREISEGRFPPGFFLTPKRRVWDEEVIDTYIEERVVSPDSAPHIKKRAKKAGN